MEKQQPLETGVKIKETALEREVRLLREEVAKAAPDVAILLAFSKNEDEGFSTQDKLSIVLEDLRGRAKNGLTERDRDYIEAAVENQRRRITEVTRNNPSAPMAQNRAAFEKFLDDVLEVATAS